jgi:hypothetical protein
MRRYWLFTLLLVPVDHELAGQSTYGNQHVLYARVIESPVDAIEFGYPVFAGSADALDANNMLPSTTDPKNAASRNLLMLSLSVNCCDACRGPSGMPASRTALRLWRYRTL